MSPSEGESLQQSWFRSATGGTPTSSSGVDQRSSFFSARTCALQRPQYHVSLASSRSGCRNACADSSSSVNTSGCASPTRALVQQLHESKPVGAL